MLSDPSQYKYWLHYAWLGVDEEVKNRHEGVGEILDCYDCWDVLESLDPTEKKKQKEMLEHASRECIEEYAAMRLFEKDTSAREALRLKDDPPGKDHKICKCVAFYDEKRCLYNRERDEVVVIGLAERSSSFDDLQGGRHQLSSIHHA